MAYMGSGEGGRKAVNIKAKETNSYYGGKSGSKVPMLSGPVRSVKHNPQQSGGINRATKGTGMGAK